MKISKLLILPLLIACMQCNAQDSSLINAEGATIETRFILPEGFKRIAANNNSFAHYLRTLPLKAHGSKVKFYNGETKSSNNHNAVINIDVGTKDLQQCADAVMRLRAEYLYKHHRYNEISFDFTNGFEAKYSRWINGERIKVNGNKTQWGKTAQALNTPAVFKKYLEIVFIYAGTISLNKSLKPKDFMKMKPGDVFIQGGSPGHAIIIVDMAENAKGEKIYMVAQSYMPAQDIHILKNPKNSSLSPWYELNPTIKIITPDWSFKTSDLKEF